MSLYDDLFSELINSAVITSLSDEQLAWVDEPIERACAAIDCPDRPDLGPECQCRSERRLEVALEQYPEAVEEFHERFQMLIDQYLEKGE